MAENSPSYGKSLPDQVDKIATLFDAHLELIVDIREIYAARSILEREYATKLQTLAKKAADKKARIEHLVVVGTDATKAYDARTMKSHTLNDAYDEIITSISSTADDHNANADALSTQVVDVLKVLERRSEEVKKKEAAHYQKLLSDRDKVYGDRLKSKQKYDEDCLEVESTRAKQNRATDDKHADRAAKQAEQQRNDMLNSKNVYLISIAIANQVKSRFYNGDLPKLEDEYQSIQTRLVQRLAKILIHCQSIQLQHLDAIKSRVASVQAKFNAVNTLKDQELYISHNIRPFSEPLNWKFEPCTGHYDTEAMSVEPTPKVFIQNKLRRSKEKQQEIQALISSKKIEAGQLARQVKDYKPDHQTGKIDDFVDGYLEAEHQLGFYLISEHILKTEAETIVSAIGSDVGSQNPHQFKSSVFSIPTTCGYCKSSIWGLSKQGKTCKACGVSVHSKCELKIPANCGQEEEQPTSSPSLTRSNTSATTRTTVSSRLSVSTPANTQILTPTPSSFVKEPHSDESPPGEAYPTVSALFDFPGSSEFELAIHEGEILHMVEPDDGSGWVKVSNSKGRSGLVPATYIEEAESNSVSPGPSISSFGSGQRVRAVYEYKSQGPDELSLYEGEVLELSSGSTGGRNYAEGWWEGFNSQGRKGIFPSNYVESA
ncbi:hypothetical protein FA15DRAFT_670509 [Coprinopsis marcescibilis]|uniref:FCH-domain-containing protein n=1 Tax=Coprinopsis marcescibilis TaxID=230819 RepID=A0A5C3KT59_COPMA|nr:hypothetical protein FA15DRAFT_670509 [Coprinopsis marcescibilis]